MFFLTLLIFQTVATSAKILHHGIDRHFETDNGLSVPEIIEEPIDAPLETWDDPLWVLKLNDFLNFTHLSSATMPEEEYFDATIGPQLHRHALQYYEYKQQQASKRVKKDDPNKSYPSNHFHDIMDPDKNENDGVTEGKGADTMKELKSTVVQMINKFVLSFQNEPAINLSEDMDAYNQPTLTLYFKGPFTTLLVNYERVEWQFIIKPPSPLPNWFYNEHSNFILDKNGMYVYIPSVVREKFLEKLINLLTKLFGFPID